MILSMRLVIEEMIRDFLDLIYRNRTTIDRDHTAIWMLEGAK
ncbi:hypothetical protein RRSWK_07075 [Rhodopirellula sp. SWK7]|nr:hypothetical protein RRSWK_07075 [Rhodopirellula sp. SWK7]